MSFEPGSPREVDPADLHDPFESGDVVVETPSARPAPTSTHRVHRSGRLDRRGRALRWMPAKPIGPIQGPLILVGIFFVWVISAITVGGDPDVPKGFSFLIHNLLGTVPLALFALVALDLPVRATILGEPRIPRLTILAVVFGVTCGMTTDFVANWILTDAMPAAELRDQVREFGSWATGDTPLERFWLFSSIVLAGPLCEELLWRGVVLNLLMRCWRPWPALLVSALLFGLLHLNAAQVVSAALVGVMLGWVFHRTGSLLAPILIHAITNGVWWLEWEYPLFGSVIFAGWTIVFAAGVAVGTGWWMFRETRGDAPGRGVTFLPTRMQWGMLVGPMLVFMALSWIVGNLGGLLAGPHARGFQLNVWPIDAIHAGSLTPRGSSDPYWYEMNRLLAQLRGAGKLGEITFQDYNAWVREAGDRWGWSIQERQSLAENADYDTATEQERIRLHEIRASVRERFGIEPRPLSRWSLENGLGEASD